jgi:hypothetical protein
MWACVQQAWSYKTSVGKVDVGLMSEFVDMSVHGRRAPCQPCNPGTRRRPPPHPLTTSRTRTHRSVLPTHLNGCWPLLQVELHTCPPPHPVNTFPFLLLTRPPPTALQ